MCLQCRSLTVRCTSFFLSFFTLVSSCLGLGRNLATKTGGNKGARIMKWTTAGRGGFGCNKRSPVGLGGGGRQGI
ncbi:hypothetical protein HOY80DRAFT_965163 [Tuber brumale]|nr:hypothetical protein HOY80DRAFT_965163 [Tuber brumale]